jgi:NADH-quinone oxidoreductase subunit H
MDSSDSIEGLSLIGLFAGAGLFGGIAIYALAAVYAERKVSAFIQDRLGPMETGPKGIFQTAADIIKLLLKEHIVPTAADKILFALAPLIVFLSVFAGFSAIPFAPGLVSAPLNAGLLFIVAIISIELVGILMAGWGSNNKYALMGAVRAVSQIISYEIPAALALLAAIVMTGTLDLQLIGSAQSGSWGLLEFNAIRYPHLLLAFLVYFTTILAETNRAPFDLAEAESELIAGFHTEYSGFRFALFMLAEYANMLLLSLLAVIVFWGAGNSPFPDLGGIALHQWTQGDSGSISEWVWSIFWLLSKSLFLVVIMMWLRWTLPRVRPDQLLQICWKYLVPIGLVLIGISAVWQLFRIYA